MFDYLKGSSTKLSDNNFFHPQNNLNLCGYTLCICLFNLKIKGIVCTIHDYDIRKWNTVSVSKCCVITTQYNIVTSIFMTNVT